MTEITRAYALSRGIDLSLHECPCEFCMRSSALCPATQSSIAEELGMDRPCICNEPWFEEGNHVCEPCEEFIRAREYERLSRIEPEADDGTTDCPF